MQQSETTTPLEKLKRGYSKLLGVDPQVFGRPGFVLVETVLREQPEWANWILPLWLFKLQSTVICSVAPRYAARARAAFAEWQPPSLLTPEALAPARWVIDAPPADTLEWVQAELLYYPHAEPPQQSETHHVEQLHAGAEGSERLLRTFDGGIFAVRAPDGTLAAHAAIKNKGILRELAVGTDEPYRRTGMGKAVVSHAVAHIVGAGQVAVYWPDSLSNRASYALASSVGFEKVAEMCFCCYPEPDWPGFEVPA